MSVLIGRKAMYNPIFNGEIQYSNGIEFTPCKKNVQVEDATIQGVIIQDRHDTVLITGPIELNGWYPVYLMAKTYITLLDNDIYREDQINDN
jgi:hypothetical protein